MGDGKNMKLDNILLYIIFTELILGGLGKLFNLPIRIGIYSVGMIYTLFYIISQKVYLTKRTWTYIGALILFAVYGSVLGLLKGNSIGNIIGDANVFISVFYIIIFAVLIKEDKSKLNKLSIIFIIYSVMLSIVTFIIFKWSYYALNSGIDVLHVLLSFQSKTQYGLITGMLYSNAYVRVYFANGIFMQIAFALCLIRLAYKNKIAIVCFENISILFLVLGIIASSTRGYWLGTLFVIFLVIFFIRKTKKSILLVNLIIVFLGVGIAFSTLGSASINGNNGNNSIAEDIIGRAQTSTDFSGNEISNSIRNIQANYLFKGIMKSPIFGSGFGAILQEYQEETGMSGLNVELYYLELFFKTGILGMLIILGVFVHIMITAYRVGKQVSSEEEKLLIKGWTLGFLSALVSGITNPYFAGAHGFFIPLFIIILLDYVDSKTDKVEIHQILKIN